MAAPNLNYVWGIADDVLRDVYVRGKYRDVILPMAVLRPLNVALDPTKQAVLDMKATLRDVRAQTQQQHVWVDVLSYLDGSSPQRAGHPGQLWVPLPFPTKGSPMSPQCGFGPPFHI